MASGITVSVPPSPTATAYSQNIVVGSPIKLALIVGWLLCATFMFVAAHYDKDIASRQGTTTGQIVGHELSNHNRYGYKFRARGHEYSGWKIPLKAEPRIGQYVTVYYDTRNPDESALTDYNDLSDVWAGRAWFVSFCAGFMLLFVFLIERLARGSNALVWPLLG
jgi:hypothetical protein